MKDEFKKQSWAEIFQKQRSKWGDIHPETKVIQSKKIYKRKSKNRKEEEYNKKNNNKT